MDFVKRSIFSRVDKFIVLLLLLTILINNIYGIQVRQYLQLIDLLNYDQAQCSLIYGYDYGYGTTYKVDPPAKLSNGKSRPLVEKYGIMITSELSAKFYFNFFNFFRYSVFYYFIPLYIEPFSIKYQFMRIEDPTTSPYIALGLARDIKLLQFQTYVQEQMKTIKESALEQLFVDDQSAIIPDFEQFGYEGNYINSYQDPFWQFSLVTWLYDETKSWYGDKDYFSFKIIS
ncbi:UNKNOWN [Stylonychia lemnae]|uniref:Transmembrane protein n=1 Tax=Stylonychia lemnae TaxID=5949 RepID=A0A078AW14_STYLE|nr:UNKNOWN [Stylonychia lemnae]|eukprot:CDW86655.1 UNKNOWN [Stylonychia lemnae]